MANESENKKQIPSPDETGAQGGPVLEETVIVEEEIPATPANNPASAGPGADNPENAGAAGAKTPDKSGAAEGETPIPPQTMEEVIAEETGEPVPGEKAAADIPAPSSEAGEPQPDDYVPPLPDESTRVIPADDLEKVPVKTSVGQWWFIGIATLILIAIAVTFHDAGPRENQAAQATFTSMGKPIIDGAAEASGLRTSYGYPIFTLTARTKEADVFVQFLHGPLPAAKASEFGLMACERLARAYVVKGYMPRHLTVHVYSRQEKGPRRYYGKAIFNGNLDELIWEGAPETING